MSRSQKNADDSHPEYYSRNISTSSNNRRIRIRNPSLRKYFQEEDVIRYEGHIDESK